MSTEVVFWLPTKYGIFVQYKEFREISRNSGAFWLWIFEEFRTFLHTEFRIYFMVIPDSPLAAPGRFYTTKAFTAPGRDTTGALKCVLWEIYEILYMKLITEFHKILSNYATKNSAKFCWILANFAQNTEAQKTDGIPCWRNSLDTLVPTTWRDMYRIKRQISNVTDA